MTTANFAADPDGTLKAPFPYFGGKSRVASIVWDRFGDVPNYVEPFAGSLAVLLARPHEPKIETVNDMCGFIANFWRATRADPDAVAHHADWPVNETDMHARHAWLVGRKDSLQAQLEGDPDFFDAKVAGWWVWGICLWIGGGWCTGDGPWQVVVIDGVRQLVRAASDGLGQRRKLVHLGDAGRGVNRQVVHLGDAGRGVNRQVVHLGNAGLGVNRQRVNLRHQGQGVNRQVVHLGNAGRGVNRQVVHLGNAGSDPSVRGVCDDWSEHLTDMMRALSDRLRRVRVCCGDWSRVCGPTPTVKQGLTAVFLDPPYADTADRDPRLYRKDCLDVAHRVREWAIAHGDHPLFRIALCGYEGEHVMPSSWECVAWKARGGYGSQSRDGNANAVRERIWFSPHCVRPEDTTPLFRYLCEDEEEIPCTTPKTSAITSRSPSSTPVAT